MAKLQKTLDVDVPIAAVAAVFSHAISHWVGNVQNSTSAFAKALISGTASSHFQSGRTFAGVIGPAFAKEQGVKHPTSTTAKVAIPASATTYGGEMTVTASASGSKTTVRIDGHTQGLFGGTLQENVTSLGEYLKHALPDLARQYAEAAGGAAKADGGSIAQQLERLSALYESGALSEQEFTQAKQKIIAG
jgi:hypothetical protein